MKIIKILLKTLSDLKGVKDADAATEKHSKIVAGLKSAYAGLKKASAAAWKAVGVAAKGARIAAAGAGLAVAAGLREFKGWNEATAKAWAMSDATRKGFMAIRKEVLNLSVELGISKSKMADGWLESLSNGVEENNLIDFMRTAGKVSVAEGSEVADVVGGITTVLNAFGIASSESERIADSMFQTVRKGGASFSELADTIADAAPSAAEAGIKAEEILAAFASLNQGGLKPAKSMTTIKTAISALNSELGEGWAKTRTFQEGLEEVAKTSDYSQLALDKIFGKEASTGVMMLTGANFDKSIAKVKELYEASGTVAEAWHKVDSETKHWDGLVGSARAALNNLGEVADKAVRPAVKAIKTSLEEWRVNTDFFDKLEAHLVKATGLAQDLWFAVSKVGKGGELLSGIGQTLRGVATAAGQAVIALLLKAAPIIGAAIGAAAKGAIFGDEKSKEDERQAKKNLYQRDAEAMEAIGGRKEWYKAGKPTADPLRWNQPGGTWSMGKDQKEEYQAELQTVRMQRFQREGSSTAEKYMNMFGNKDITGGLQTVSNVAASGAGMRPQASAAASNHNLEQAANSGQEAAALTAENTGLMRQVFATIKAEQQKQNQLLKDMAERSKQVGG